MPYAFINYSNLKGLHVQANSFIVPEGALEKADNMVASEDGSLKKRRGFFEFNTPTATANTLHFYNGTLMHLMESKIASLTTGGVATDLTGETVSVSGMTGRSSQSNGNFYFTSNNGIMKIESPAGPVYKSGIAPGLDLQGRFIDTTGPISPNVQVAYRVVFGRRDTNNNLLLGAPSDILILAARTISSNASFSAPTVTVTENSHGLTNGDSIKVFGTFDSGGAALGLSNEFVTITVIDPNSFSFTTTSTLTGLATITWGYEQTTELEFTVPEEVDSTDYFYQIYRSSQSASENTLPFSDFKLVIEEKLTAGQISNNAVIFTDDIDEIFLGAELYTNPNSQEGELQANTRAPKALDMATFKNHTFYANTVSRHSLNLNLISTATSLIVDSNYIEVTLGVTTRRYVARNGVGNQRVTGTTTNVLTVITVTYNAHGLSNADVIYVSAATGTGTLPSGEYTISNVSANTFDFTVLVAPTTLTDIDFQGVRTTAGYYMFYLEGPTTSVSQGIANTAKGLVKAIDRDPSSLIYARYTSGFETIPGKMFLQARGFGAAFSVTAQTTAVGQAFSPALPTSGTTVQSTNDTLPNNLFVSKIGEPEAVPIVNTIPVGAKNARILRIAALRDSLIIIKEDGIFRINGDTVLGFTGSVTALDNTVFCKAANSVAVLNNQVYALTNQGVVQISDASVGIESRAIELPIAAVLGNTNLEAQTSAAGYESDRLYLLTTLKPNNNSATTVYCYNYITNQWTEWDTLFKNAIVGPGDALHYIGLNGKLYKERKNQSKLDYTGQNYTLTVASVSVDTVTVTFTGTSVIPEIGDIVVKSDVINRVASVSVVGATVVVAFQRGTNLLVADTPTLYGKYLSSIRFAPLHAGDATRSKHFSIFQAIFRNASCSALTCFFQSDRFGGSESIDWVSDINTQVGWGLEPWGLFPWGDAETINLEYTTGPNTSLRTYVPRFAGRGKYLQPVLEHDQAGEQFVLQSIGVAVRGYGERTTK